MDRKRGFCLRVVFLSLLTALCSPAHAQETDKSGVKPQVISLPTGAGSIEGLGESFEPQLNTGSAVYSVKIAVPPGVNGHQPALRLQYNSGLGNGPFGIGWNLPLPYIQRQTDKGQPTYRDGDVIVYSDGEELVPLADGTWRCENESAFLRFRRDGDGWEVRDKSGQVYRLGQYPNDTQPWRVSRTGRDESGFDETFKWYVDSFTDTNGNRIEYFYTRFADSPGRVYPSEIRYNIKGTRYNAVTIDYEARPDAYSDYRAGFQIKTARRASLIQVHSQGDLVREYRLSYDTDPAEILDPQGEGVVPLAFSLLSKITQFDKSGENYLPPLRFGYTRLHTSDRDNHPHGNFPGPEDVDLNGNGIPDGPGVHQMRDAPQNVGFQTGDADFLDVDGDGLADILHTSSDAKDKGEHFYYRNLGDDRFDLRQTMGAFPRLSLMDTGAVLSDLDGDGLADFVNQNTVNNKLVLYLYRNRGDGTWATGIQYNDQPLRFTLNASDTRLMDADFDKRIDVVRSNSGNEWVLCLNKGNTPGGFWDCNARVSMPFPPQVVFDNPAVRLADMNGDRLQDVVWIRQLSQTETLVWFWPSKGKAEFDQHLVMEAVNLGRVAVENVKLSDINADGLSDLVTIESGEVNTWINLGDGQWSEPQLFLDTPTIGSSSALRFADMNGNGTADLVWVDADPDTPEERFQYLDFVGETKPNQLNIVDNGLGRRIHIHYASATRYAVEAREAGNPWALMSPVPVQVVSQVVTTASLDLDGIAGPDTYVTDYAYRDAYYDGFEKEFRGFAFVKKIERGDATAPTQVTRLFFHTGAPDGLDNDGDKETDEWVEAAGAEEEPLKGRILKQEVTTAAGGADTPVGDGAPADNSALFDRTSNDWAIRRLHDPDGGTRELATLDVREVSFAYAEQTDTDLIELGAGLSKQTRTTFSYDDFGNLTEKKDYGVLSLPGDERFTNTEYIHDLQRWIVDKPMRQTKTNGDGKKVAETTSYYDGEPYVGLALGAVEKGNLTRQEGWVEGNKRLNLVRSAFDDFGNIIGIKDGKGNLRTLAYDPVFHTFPIAETVHVGGESPNLKVTVKYDLGFGTPTESTDFNGYTTHYRYDSFGRLVAIVRLGDSDEYPTLTFEYRPSDPARGVIYTYDPTGQLSVQPSQPLPSAIKTSAREQFGRAGTFDSLQYVDGLGRKLGVVEEGEQGFIVKEAVLFNARSTVRQAFLPTRSATSGYQVPVLSDHHLETHYDATGRPILRINPPDALGKITQASTAYLPLEKTLTDEEANPVTTVNDGLGRVIEIRELNEGETYVTRSEYDALDQLTKLTDAQHNVTTSQYDGLSRKVEAENPDRGKTIYEYDDASNLFKTIDNKGQVILYGYDGVNRILSEDYLNEAGLTPDVAYHYDQPSADYPAASNLKGKLAWVEDLTGALFRAYDARGNAVWRVKRIRDGEAVTDYTTVLTYDALDRQTSITYPDQSLVRYVYNARALLESITGLVDDIDYHESGQIATIDYTNTVRSQYAYDPRHRLIHLETASTAQGAAVLQDLEYTLDGVNNIRAIADGRSLAPSSPKSATQSFLYDDMYRLTRAQGPGYGAIDYRYDKVGNLIWKHTPAAPDPKHIKDPLMNLGTMTYGGTAGSSGRSGKKPGDPPGPHALTATQSGLAYDYDDNGNMVSHAQGDSYAWDFKDRLVRTEKEDRIAQYGYDHANQRIIKKVQEGSEEKVTYYISKAYEIRDGKPIKYIFAGNRRVARIDDEYWHSDGRGRQTLELGAGWNFFSLHVQPDDPAVSAVLAEIETAVRDIWAFDAQTQEYRGYVPSEGRFEFDEIHAHRGYAAYLESPATLVVEGSQSEVDIPLAAGWNLVGCPARRSLSLDSALASVAGSVQSLWFYEASEVEWQRYDPKAPAFLNGLQLMAPGNAYWLHVADDSELAYSSGSGVYFYLPDHLGSSNLVTDIEGEVAESTEFYPYGRARNTERVAVNSYYGFTGKEFDDATGLHYFEARYYDSVVGRFVSVDPVQYDKNWYLYAENNPLRFVDPTGLVPKDFTLPDVGNVWELVKKGISDSVPDIFVHKKGDDKGNPIFDKNQTEIISIVFADAISTINVIKLNNKMNALDESNKKLEELQKKLKNATKTKEINKLNKNIEKQKTKNRKNSEKLTDFLVDVINKDIKGAIKGDKNKEALLNEGLDYLQEIQKEQ